MKRLLYLFCMILFFNSCTKDKIDDNKDLLKIKCTFLDIENDSQIGNAEISINGKLYYTDSNGNCEISNLPNNEVNLTFDVPGYKKSQRSIIIDKNNKSSIYISLISAKSLRSIINVLDYGATGNDNTIDRYAINLAISAAQVNDYIYFPLGVYYIDQTIIINKSLTILGDGINSKIKAYDGTFNLFHIKSDNVAFDNICFKGNSNVDIPNTGKFAIYTDVSSPSSNGSVSHCYFNDFAGDANGLNNGIKLDDGSNNWTIDNCEFINLVGTSSGNGYGILLGKSWGNLIQSNNFIAVPSKGRHAIYLSAGASYNEVKYNDINGFNSSSISIFSCPHQYECKYNVITHNTINNQNSIHFTGSIEVNGKAYYNSIRYNNINNSRPYGIYIASRTGCFTMGNNIYYNTIKNTKQFAILVTSDFTDSITNIDTDIRYNSIGHVEEYNAIQVIHASRTIIYDNDIGINCPTGYQYGISLNPTPPVGIGTEILINTIRCGSVGTISTNGVPVYLENNIFLARCR